MPAFDLSQETQSLGRYDVVGERSATERGFINHVALHATDAEEIAHGQEVGVVHMGPPLETGGRINAHAAGRVPLTGSEVKTIAVWIEKIRDEYSDSGVEGEGRRQYIIHPPWEDWRDPNTGVRRYRRYSCAGFVLDAHRQVGIELLNIDEQALPEVSSRTLELAYPNVLRRRALLERLGLQGDGPWRIVLAGYVLHALKRTSGDIRQAPAQAERGDERF